MVVSGRVQGVFFRAAASAQARALGLVGYARNLDDGTVEIVAEGNHQALSALESWAHQGPPSARVEDVQSEWFDGQGEFSAFKVR
ncbi:MAG: acylphosphatase [Deltaproteobacteria bacterium]|nr:acylphosphatase [Deltaproteobacteria bacterium]